MEDEEVKKLRAFSVKSKMRIAPKKKESSAKDSSGSVGFIPVSG